MPILFTPVQVHPVESLPQDAIVVETTPMDEKKEDDERTRDGETDRC